MAAVLPRREEFNISKFQIAKFQIPIGSNWNLQLEFGISKLEFLYWNFILQKGAPLIFYDFLPMEAPILKKSK
jgi:hypothetical protein